MKKTVNLLSLKDRCKEELVLLTDEMSALWSFFCNRIEVIESLVSKEVCSEEQKVLRSVALTKQLHYHNELQSLKMWSGIVELSIPDSPSNTTMKMVDALQLFIFRSFCNLNFTLYILAVTF